MLVEGGDGRRLLIDASPDLRQQLLSAGVSALDGVLMTHAHADHSHGLDDLRLICRAMRKPLDLFGDPATLAELARRFGYAFAPIEPDFGWFRPALNARVVDGPFAAAGMHVLPFRQGHGPSLTTLGFRIGPFAYSTDASRLDDAAFGVLAGIDVWVVDCQSYQPNFVHSHLEQTLAWIERVKPRRSILTHMGHDFDYSELASRLPGWVEPAVDGLVVTVETKPTVGMVDTSLSG